MLRQSKYNNISQKLLKEADAILDPKDVKKFVTLNRKWDSKLNRWVMGVKENIPGKCRIFDPYAKDGAKEIYIAYEIGLDGNGDPKIGDLMLEREHAGEIICDGRKAKDRIKYQYLKLCNWNKDNKSNEFHVEPMKYIFREDDVVKKAIEKVSTVTLKAEATVAIMGMSHSELTEYCRGLGFPHHANQQVMQESLINFANASDDNARRVKGLARETEVKFASDINLAKDLNIIKYDSKCWKWVDGDSAFYVVTAGLDPVKDLTTHFLSSKGEKVYEQLIEMIVDREEKAKAEALAKK